MTQSEYELTNARDTTHATMLLVGRLSGRWLLCIATVVIAQYGISVVGGIGDGDGGGGGGEDHQHRTDHETRRQLGGGGSIFAQGVAISSTKVRLPLPLNTRSFGILLCRALAKTPSLPSLLQVSECMGALILFTLAFDVLMERLEHHFKHQPRAQNVMRKLLTELTVLGFISFLVFLLINTGILSHSPYFVAFEFAHIMLFFVAMILIAQAVATFRVWNNVNELWMRTSLATPAQLRSDWRAVTAPKKATLGRSHHAIVRHVPGMGTAKLQRVVEFHLLKTLFLGRCNLPLDFSFATYLSQTLAVYISNSVDVDSQSWAVILVLIAVNIARARAFGETYDDTLMLLMFGASGVLIMLAYVALGSPALLLEPLLGVRSLPAPLSDTHTHTHTHTHTCASFFFLQICGPHQCRGAQHAPPH